jgi:hypothetical protein
VRARDVARAWRLGGGAFEVHRREGVARALSPAARKKGHGKV